MGKTLDVARDRAFDQSKTVLPVEMARGVYMRHAPSLQALKLMHLMIGTAGGRMADEVQHEIRLSDIRKIEGLNNHTRASLTPLFGELRAAVLTHDDPEKMVVIIGGLLDEARIDYRNEASGDLVVSWWFARTFRRMAAESNHWAILDRQTVFHLGSRYSVLLFQHVASLVNLDRVTAKTFSVAELRAVLGVPEGKLNRYADLNRRAIQPAVEEINQLSRLTLTATPNKIGRTVDSVTIAWQVKDDPAPAKRELQGHSAGRKARRDGTAETVADGLPPFPQVGGFTYSPLWQREFEAAWAALGRVHGDRPDSGRVADHVRRIAREQGLAPDSPKLPALLRNVLKNWQK
mgnify:CR=1 FL=1